MVPSMQLLKQSSPQFCVWFIMLIFIFVDISGLVYRHCFEQDKFEGIKGEIRSRKSNDRQYNSDGKQVH
jgi:hypothetical protein